ncbi:Nramp family divalent metal transporter [Anatilimnocola floriformis]|uniref:Nramp family divalent metal transporter n=1 Tax=Anatilimnocola floriformis TaxID=2948575 RepID=UPI0020C374CF|nr:Nramp family divalent metal transporter [Anatilimnocola floriformis]
MPDKKKLDSSASPQGYPDVAVQAKPEKSRFDPYEMPPEAVQDPPTSLWTALRQIGPGIILAGTIVGSGELLLTTSLGARQGFIFLWLILFSCVIKVFVQTELGRYAISSGKPTLGAINELGGPHFGAHWIVWWWFVMMASTIFQLGAMTGTVGQSLNLAFPQASIQLANSVEGILPALSKSILDRPEYPWAILTCITAIALLWSGNYRRIEIVTTFLVVSVTLLTVTATCALPFTDYPIRWGEVAQGLTFQLPKEQAPKDEQSTKDEQTPKGEQAPKDDESPKQDQSPKGDQTPKDEQEPKSQAPKSQLPSDAIMVAFGVFGITGVGATELFYYPYWCLEKGYARYTGQQQPTAAWEHRAKGWIRVMYLDAWVSMVVFTISTLAFYFMGAAVLYPQGLNPQGKDMIETLSKMFTGTFGTWTQLVFLIGAAAVLFKTLYLASAGNGRLIADFLVLNKAVEYTAPGQRSRVIQRVSVLIPIIALVLFLCFKEPKFMVVVGGFGQALTLPIISATTLYFRYRKLDRRLTPSLLIDICLWVAFVSITAVAVYALRNQIETLVWPKK